MSNFVTGQGLFGATSNQNKNQPSSMPGAPAASPSPFANMGANTTNSSLFGGPGTSTGAGNMPGSGGTTSGTTGGIFGTSGSAFGGGGNTGPTAPTLAGPGTASPFGGGGLFGGVHASYSSFMELSHLNYHFSKTCDNPIGHGGSDRELAIPECRFEHRRSWDDAWRSLRKYHQHEYSDHWRCARSNHS